MEKEKFRDSYFCWLLVTLALVASPLSCNQIKSWGLERRWRWWQNKWITPQGGCPEGGVTASKALKILALPRRGGGGCPLPRTFWWIWQSDNGPPKVITFPPKVTIPVKEYLNLPECECAITHTDTVSPKGWAVYLWDKYPCSLLRCHLWWSQKIQSTYCLWLQI